MRIGINTLAAVPGKSGGDGTYVRALVEHLARIDSENDYFLFVADYNRAWFDIPQRNFRQVICRVPNSFSLRVLWEHTWLGIAANRIRLDVFHAPVNISPLLLQGKSVITIHDAVYARNEYSIPLPIRMYWRVFRPLSARRASRIIVVSEKNKQELVDLGAIEGRKAQVIYHGVQGRFRPLDRADCRAWTRQSLNLDKPFLLWVGRPYSSKNLVRLVAAFALFNARADGKYLLALVGPEGWDELAIKDVVQSEKLEGMVRRIGYIENSELPRLYNAAQALAFPSLEESFGLPAVEAMACGTPVIAANVSSMPEILGGAGELVDPLRVEGIAEGLEAVLCNPARWEACRHLGLQRAKMFTWEENAWRTLRLYEELFHSA